MINSSHIYEKQSLFFVFLFLQGQVAMLEITLCGSISGRFSQFSKAWTLFCEIVKEVKKKDLNIAGFWLKITPGILGQFSTFACLQCKQHIIY